MVTCDRCRKEIQEGEKVTINGGEYDWGGYDFCEKCADTFYERLEQFLTDFGYQCWKTKKQ